MRNFCYLAMLSLVLLASCSFTNKKFQNPDNEKLLMETLIYVVTNGHYSPIEINEEFSKKVFKGYMEQLDSQKHYFLQSDYNEFKKHQTKLGNYWLELKTDFFDLTYNRFKQRMQEAEKICQEILKQPFDFSKNETINTDYENLPFPKDKNELKERWRKQLKFSALSTYLLRQKEEQTKKEKDANYTPKKDTEILAEVSETTRKNYEDLFVAFKDMTREEWFAAYMNSYVQVFDPHTNYFAPDIKEQFESSMAGKFEGIGAQLQKKSDGIHITNIISGGPVWKGKLLEVGDIILKVADRTSEPVDVVGMRLDKAIKLIKGPKGTEVRLTVKKADGTIQEVAIIRDVIQIEETFAKTTLIKDGNKTYGLIDLPAFYINMQNRKERNAASDMALEIAKLKKLNVSGLILDLRNNGGGSLSAVVDIVGMFIKEGAVVQVRSSNGVVQVLRDKDRNIQWEKPLVILVNENSASASEIFAAAMQDYKRGIVLGSPQTHGKGTVQTVVDLNQYVRNSNFDLGSVKLTIQKYYRIDGGSTQLKGVQSDIVVPDNYTYLDMGERDHENPMEWDKIQPSNYTQWTENTQFQEAIRKSNERIAQNPLFKLIDQNAKWLKERKDKNIYSLQYEQFKTDLQDEENKNKQLKDAIKTIVGIKFQPLPSEEELMKTDEDFKLRRKRWYEALEKDLYVEEAVKVLNDLVL